MMNYFNDINNVKNYIEMTAGYDGRELIKILKKYLPPGSSLLELGMGPGKDLDLLSHTFQVTGSDSSQTFLDIYRQKVMDADLLLLDARTLETVRRFDAIYSNKVLHHLSEGDLRQSFLRQKTVLNPRGFLFHSFWLGDKEEFFDGLRFRYYPQATLLQMVDIHFEVLETKIYAEFEENDSIYLVLQLWDTST